MPDSGQIAYEARFAGLVGTRNILTWADLPEEAREIWVRVETAVLAGAHRLQTVAEAWDAQLSENPEVLQLGQSAARVASLVEAITGKGWGTAVPLQPPRALGFAGEIEPSAVVHVPAASSQDHDLARAAGFTGNVCSSCGALAMVRTGTCETCQACASTSGGCS